MNMNYADERWNAYTDKKALLRRGSARDSSAAWWIGIQ